MTHMHLILLSVNSVVVPEGYVVILSKKVNMIVKLRPLKIIAHSTDSNTGSLCGGLHGKQ